MKHLLELSTGIFGLMMLLNLIAPFVRRRREARDRFEKRNEEQPETETEPVVPAAAPAFPPIPADENPATYFKAVVRHGLLGILFLPLAALFLAMNARILADCWSLLLDRNGVLWGTLKAFGFSLKITDLDVIGSCLAIAQVMLSAACAQLWSRYPRARYLLLALFGLSAACEVGLSGYRGILLASQNPALAPWTQGLFSAMQALVSVAVEAVAGYFTLHCFASPLAEGILWTLVIPFRLAAHGYRVLTHMFSMRKKPARRSPGLITAMAAHLDEAILDPLRNLDVAALGAVKAVTSHFRR